MTKHGYGFRLNHPDFEVFKRNVVVPKEIPGWVLKGGGVPDNRGHKFWKDRLVNCGSVYRVILADKIRTIIKDNNLDEVMVPAKVLIPSLVGKYEVDPNKKYYVASERMDVKRFSKSRTWVNKQTLEYQKKIAEQICTIIEQAAGRFYQLKFTSKTFDKIVLNNQALLILIIKIYRLQKEKILKLHLLIQNPMEPSEIGFHTQP